MIHILLFQFYDSTIKSIADFNPTAQFWNFNSTIVRLKEFEIALARTGRTEAEINEALKEAIVRNVGIRFDSMEDKRDLDTYHNFNKQPMF